MKRTGRGTFQMNYIGILFLLQICTAVEYTVPENTRFYRFDFTYPVNKVTRSSPPIKQGGCLTNEFCFQIFNASRGAIIEGIISRNASAVVFYVRESSTPRAIIFKQPGTAAPKLPDDAAVVQTVEAESQYGVQFLTIFEKEVENITVFGDAQLAPADLPEKNLTVYSPLCMSLITLASLINVLTFAVLCDVTDPAFKNIFYITGTMNKKPMSFVMHYAHSETEEFLFVPGIEHRAPYRAYYVTDFGSVASVNSLSWVLLATVTIYLFSM